MDQLFILHNCFESQEMERKDLESVCIAKLISTFHSAQGKDCWILSSDNKIQLLRLEKHPMEAQEEFCAILGYTKEHATVYDEHLQYVLPQDHMDYQVYE